MLSDIVGSTELWQHFPDAMPAATLKHGQLMRAAITQAGGYEFGTAGDSFAVAFSSASQAVEAAAAAQRALEAQDWQEAPIRVRIGLHSGQADERDGRYFGAVVNRADRIESVASPGQVLVSAATHALAVGHVGDDIGFRDLGEHPLRSFERPERLYLVLAEGLLDDGGQVFSQLVCDNLPNPPTAFVGRASDVTELGSSITPGSMITITGLGGLGKTRLAIEAARQATERFSDGVWWIDLSPLTDGSSIDLHVAAALGITTQAGASSDAALIDGLRRQQALLIFDNCEHVLADSAQLIASLQSACPELCLLATSREPLDLAGEQNWPLASLASATDGVALLIQRARAHDAKFDPTRWPAPDLIRLCDRLDGMPLAIEMAAARLRALAPAEIIDRLDDRFRLLRNKDRQAAARHQTLVAALDWSYELLDEDERLLLDRLSIFDGSFDVRAAEQVCADDALDEYDIIDLLGSLLEKSLVSLVDSTGTNRFRLLETVRQYCGTHLTDEQANTLRQALIMFSVELATVGEQQWLGDTSADYDLAYATFNTEWDNFRAAVRWAIESADGEACNAIFRALWIFAFESFRTEIGDWARSALSLDEPPLMAIGVAAVTGKNREGSIELLAKGVSMVDESVPSHDACLLYGVLHGMHIAQGGETARSYAERAVFHASAMSTSRLASHRANMAMMLTTSDPEQAAEHAQFSRDYLDRSTNPWRAACVSPLAMYEARRGRPEVGHQLCMRGLEMSTEGGLAWTLNSVLACRARIALRYNVGEPQADLIEALETGRESRAWYAMWLAMAESVAWFQTHYSTDLAAVVAGYMSNRGIWFRSPEADSLNADDGDRQSSQAHKLGSRMRRDDLIDYVLNTLAA